MKRKEFFRTVAVGSAAAFVGFPLFEAKSKPTLTTAKNQSIEINWSNDEPSNPFVDSNLRISQSGINLVDEQTPNSGTFVLNSSSRIQVMQIGVYQWPTDGHATLIVSKVSISDGSTTEIYSNRTNVWVNGIIDSFEFDPEFYYNYNIQCYTWYREEPLPY